jgi:ABC-type hemin transport system substrate-binding protein
MMAALLIEEESANELEKKAKAKLEAKAKESKEKAAKKQVTSVYITNYPTLISADKPSSFPVPT